MLCCVDYRINVVGGAVVAGVIVFKNVSSSDTDFRSSVITEEDSVQTDDDIYYDDYEEKEISRPIEKPSVSDEKSAKKDEFLQKADDIEQYSKSHFETAQTQSEINRESGIVYEKWDELLNEVYQYLKTTMPDSEFEQLKNDEFAWIKRKEKAVEEAGEEWAGGSGAPMARNTAAIQQTEERCYYLISLIK